MPRGPYKIYEHDPAAPVPKTTCFNRKKCKHEEGEHGAECRDSGETDNNTVCIYTN